MQDQVREERFLEGGCEALYELMREPSDESDRVGDEVPPAFVLEAARRRIERLEEAVVN